MNRPVIITVNLSLSQAQMQLAISVLQEKAQALEHASESTSRPGERGQYLEVLQRVRALHQVFTQAYNGIFEEGPHDTEKK